MGAGLGVAVADQNPKTLSGVVEVHEQVAGQLGQPSAGGMRGDTEDVHAAGRMLDDEEHVQPRNVACRGGTSRKPGSRALGPARTQLALHPCDIPSSGSPGPSAAPVWR